MIRTFYKPEQLDKLSGDAWIKCQFNINTYAVMYMRVGNQWYRPITDELIDSEELMTSYMVVTEDDEYPSW